MFLIFAIILRLNLNSNMIFPLPDIISSQDELEIFWKLAIAIVTGGLIGLEREIIIQKNNKPSFGGIRTYIFIAMLGFVSAYLSSYLNPFLLIIVFLSIAVFLFINYTSKIKDGHSHGITSELSAIVTFLIGTLSFSNAALAIVITVITALILSEKTLLHSFAKKVKNEEFGATVEFAILAFIILPLLPNQTIDPWDVLNPYKVWLLILFILGISFIGYILTRIVGTKKGILLAGVIGGLASSTAVTQSMSQKSKIEPFLSRVFSVATIAASGIMFIRVAIEVFTFNRELLRMLAIPLGLMFIATIFECFLNVYLLEKNEKHSKQNRNDLIHESPFKLVPALKFAVFFILVLFITEFTNKYLGAKGIYIAAIISGAVDVDAFTFSMIKIASEDPGFLGTATKAITLVVASNMFFKGGMTYIFGSKEFSKIIFANFLITVIIGLLTLFII